MLFHTHNLETQYTIFVLREEERIEAIRHAYPTYAANLDDTLDGILDEFWNFFDDCAALKLDADAVMRLAAAKLKRANSNLAFAEGRIKGGFEVEGGEGERLDDAMFVEEKDHGEEVGQTHRGEDEGVWAVPLVCITLTPPTPTDESFRSIKEAHDSEIGEKNEHERLEPLENDTNQGANKDKEQTGKAHRVEHQDVHAVNPPRTDLPSCPPTSTQESMKPIKEDHNRNIGEKSEDKHLQPLATGNEERKEQQQHQPEDISQTDRSPSPPTPPPESLQRLKKNQDSKIDQKNKSQHARPLSTVDDNEDKHQHHQPQSSQPNPSPAPHKRRAPFLTRKRAQHDKTQGLDNAEDSGYDSHGETAYDDILISDLAARFQRLCI